MTLMTIPNDSKVTPSFRMSLSWAFAYAILFLSIIISGLKPIGISADLQNYEILYDISAVSDWRSIFEGGDFGYFALTKLSAAVGLSFSQFSFYFAAFTCIVLFIVFININTNRTALVAIYGSYLFWLHEYTQIRIAAAIAVGLYAIYGSGRIARWPLFFVAILLHNSFVIVVFAYIVIGLRPRDLIIVFSIISLMLLAGRFTDFLNDLVHRVVAYQDLASTTGQFSTINLFSLMPIFQVFGIGLALFFRRRLPANSVQEILLSSAGVVAFYAFSSVPVLAFRTNELFMPFFVILLSRLTRCSSASWLVILPWIALGIHNTFLAPDALVIR